MDFWGILGTVAFVAGALLLIPLDRELEKRRDARRRNQARPWREFE